MKLIAFDLGTGGVKASLYNEEMSSLAKSFIEYKTFFPALNRHEQRPEDWWLSVVESTRHLLEKTGVSGSDIAGLALSGASLVAVPMDAEGNLLLSQVPIWSDMRAEEETKEFFQRIGEREWYLTTGNGFPAPAYSIFKLMWLKKHLPEVFRKTAFVLGSKDYINFRLTGKAAMDRSYASGTGAYDLQREEMRTDFLEAAGLPADIFPQVVPSHSVVGTITAEASRMIGLPEGTPVICGGVDNACMALGAVGAEAGKAYVSLGTSSWIPVNSQRPILDEKKKPYVFAHLQEDLYTSAFSIFSGGNSLRWARETLCGDLQGENVYAEMDRMAAGVPAGAGGVLFNPSLAGGTSQDKSIHIRGGYLGVTLGTRREELIRATLEGVALNLRFSLDALRQKAEISDRLLICGGGSKSRIWMQIFANVFGMTVYKTNVDQDAASLGAAAAAARGIGLWKDYSAVPKLHHTEYECFVESEKAEIYESLLPVFEEMCSAAASIGDKLHELGM